jgi:hypothetical protein
MRRKSIILMAAVLVLFWASFGFAGETGVGKSKGNMLQSVSASSEDIRIEIHYLDGEQLVERYGEKNNPFIGLGPSPLTTFIISIKTPVDVRLDLATVELQAGGMTVRPLRDFFITTYWNGKLRNQGRNYIPRTYKGWSAGKIQYNTRKYMVPARLKVKADETYEGLVVFEGRLPRYDKVTLVLPVYSASGELLHPFRFEYGG